MAVFFNKYKMWILGIISGILIGFIIWLFVKAKKDKAVNAKQSAKDVIIPEETDSRDISGGIDESPYTPKYFTHTEFDSKGSPGSGKNMKNSTLRMLDKAREISGLPFKINSGFRTVAHNKAVGGKSNSAHLRGYAADIHVTETTLRPILKALYKAGFRRFGVSKTFVHVDNDSSLPQAVWDYKNLPNNPYKTIQQIAAL